MAASKSYLARANYRFLPGDHRDSPIKSDSLLELEESDVWNSAARSESPDFRNSVPAARAAKKSSAVKRGPEAVATAASLPMNVPDWSKILKEDCKDSRRWYSEDGSDGEGGGGGSWIPPHEFLARTRIASFSVHEGVGRTLKGRDLRKCHFSSPMHCHACSFHLHPLFCRHHKEESEKEERKDQRLPPSVTFTPCFLNGFLNY